MQKSKSLSLGLTMLGTILLSGCGEEQHSAAKTTAPQVSTEEPAAQLSSNETPEKTNPPSATPAPSDAAYKAATIILKEKAAQALKKTKDAPATAIASATANATALTSEAKQKAGQLKQSVTEQAQALGDNAESLLKQ
ncbi:MAG: hypothetical protein ACPG4U_11220 [Pseudomonadales bacterium]